MGVDFPAAELPDEEVLGAGVLLVMRGAGSSTGIFTRGGLLSVLDRSFAGEGLLRGRGASTLGAGR
jgi:hypothetical protein